MSFVVVLNPQAGRGQALRAHDALRRALPDVQIIVALSAADALERLRALPKGESVLAVGGDGTVFGLLPALLSGERTLGIAPLGSGNDFSALLGFGAGDLQASLARMSRPPVRVDTLQAEYAGRQVPLLNGLGMGFDAQVADLMRRSPKWLSGFGRYLWAALRGVWGLRLGVVEVTVDGAPMYSGPSCLVAVMNGSRYGGGFHVAPEADPHDGLLDVVLGTRVSRMGLLRLLLQVLRGQHQHDPRVRMARGRSVTIRWAEPTHTHLDGELVGPQQELHVWVQPSSLPIHL